MLRKVVQFFESYIQVEASPQDIEHALNLATAALLIEMSRIDNQVSDEERHHFEKVLVEEYGIAESEIQELDQLAQQELGDATDYYQFTSLINQHFGREQKVTMIEHLWAIAFADGKVDSFEEHYLRKIADLLFVPHSEFIKAKLKILGH